MSQPNFYVVRIVAMLSGLNKYEELVIDSVKAINRKTVPGPLEYIRTTLDTKAEERRKADYPRCKPITVQLVEAKWGDAAHIDFNDRRGTFLAIELLPVTDPITL